MINSPHSHRFHILRKNVRRYFRRLKHRIQDLVVPPLPPQMYIPVNPRRIRYAGLGWSSVPDSQRGITLRGDWDLMKAPIDDRLPARALKARVQAGITWDQAGYSWEALEQTEEGRRIKAAYPQKEVWQRRLEEIDALCKEMKSNDGAYPPGSALGQEEARVRVGRGGEILAEADPYRLILAKILGIQSMPARVTARHPGWMSFRKEVLAYARDVGGKVYHPITHPDLHDIPSGHGEYRWKLIEKYLPVQSGRVLDVGANFGYFCHMFEDKGFECTAVELRPRNIYFLEKLKAAEDRQFDIFKGSIFDFYSDDEYDIVIALNIFHHFLRVQDRYEQLIQFLRRTRMRSMFLETHNPGEPHMLGTYRNYKPDEYVQFILDNSCLVKSTFLQTVNGGRNIYLLTSV